MNSELWVAVIAAGSALVGVVLSQVLTLLHGHLDRKHARRLLLQAEI